MPTVPYITPIDTPPSRADAANFSARTDTFLGELPLMQTQMNTMGDFVNDRADVALAAAASAVASPATNANSTTSLSISVASKAATIEAGKSIVKDMWVAFMHSADPTMWMSGPVVSYSGTALVVNIQNISGSGTFADWTIYAIQPSMSATSPRALADGSTVTDPGGTARAVGFRGLPLNAAKTAAYTLAAADMGMCVSTNTAVTFPLNSAVALPIGDLYCVYNNSASAISLVQPAGLTMRLEGTATVGGRTVAAYSKAFLHKVGINEVVVSGTGVS